MNGEDFAAHLDKVSATQNDSWVACCPAHEDRNPSLSLRELPDGRLLVHCFAGCSVEEIVNAMGLTLSDLFPEPLPSDVNYRRGLKRPYPAGAVLKVVQNEMVIAQLAAEQLARGEALNDEDRERLTKAAERLHEAASWA